MLIKILKSTKKIKGILQYGFPESQNIINTSNPETKKS